jgi:hypothetical protein
MYVARDADGKQVALKELAFVQSPTLAAIAAFEREAKILRALEHPAIPRFVASFEEGEGVHVRYYLAQELVTGEALDARLGDHWFTEPEIIDLARQVLGVLVYLQGLSPMVIHRDIKPANLLARADGSIAVVDFGAAYVQGATAGSTTIGTFGYMPIEQLAGLVDATTDPYALGASLIHLLTRREPWRILQGSALEQINVSPALRAFLGKLVAAEPRDRFPNAAAALEALDRVAKGEPAPAAAEPPRPRRARWRPPVMAAAAAGVALAAASLGAAGYAYLASPGQAEVPPAGAYGGEPDRELAEMIAFKDEMCRCPVGDRACAERVSGKLERGARLTAGEAERERVAAILRETARCMKDAMSPSATLRLTLPPGVPGELYIDGAPAPGPAVVDGSEVPIAPGRHALRVVGPGGVACNAEGTFELGKTTTIHCIHVPPSSVPQDSTPHTVKPSTLEANRLRGTTRIEPDDATRQEIAKAGVARVVGAFRLCVDAAGEVVEVRKLKSTGFEAYDRKIDAEIQRWAFRPIQLGDTPVAVCTAVTFVYASP